MPWLILLCAGLLEIVWAIAMKLSDGFTRAGPTVVCIGAAAASFLLLSISLRSLPVGTAYAAWVGIGVSGVAAIGIAVFEESASPTRLLLLGLIVTGVIGLRMLDG